MISKALGSLVKELRFKKKISQEKLAELCGVDRTYIYRIESGLREPSLSSFIKLAKGLEISPTELLSLLEDKLK